VAAEFFIVKSQNTVPNNPAVLRMQNTETCGMQAVLHSVVVPTYSEEIFASPKLIAIFL
jgi:hypothetical protein